MANNNNRGDILYNKKKFNEKYHQRLTITFEDGSSESVWPSAGFSGDWKGLIEHLTHGRGKYKTVLINLN